MVIIVVLSKSTHAHVGSGMKHSTVRSPHTRKLENTRVGRRNVISFMWIPMRHPFKCLQGRVNRNFCPYLCSFGVSTYPEVIKISMDLKLWDV